jgi:putative flippase GtrA
MDDAPRTPAAPGPLASFARFVVLGGGVGVLSSGAVALLAEQMPWALANALITVVSTLLCTELHARFTFGSGRSAGWREHWQSAGSAAVAYVVTCAAMFVRLPRRLGTRRPRPLPAAAPVRLRHRSRPDGRAGAEGGRDGVLAGAGAGADKPPAPRGATSPSRTDRGAPPAPDRTTAPAPEVGGSGPRRRPLATTARSASGVGRATGRDTVRCQVTRAAHDAAPERITNRAPVLRVNS